MAALSAGRRADARAVVLFLVLGFALSWYPWFLFLAGYPAAPGPNPLGLLVAALIAASVAAGWRGPVAILRGIVRVRAPLAVWAMAVLVPLGVLAAALAIGVLRNVGVAPAAPVWPDLAERMILAFLFVALGEEPAWRGFLLPEMQNRLHPILATFAVAAIWALWHLPLMGTEFAWPLVPAFLASVAGGAIVLSWLYNASGASILLPMVTHALVNTAGAGYVFGFVAKADLAHFWWIYAGLWLVAGGLTIVLTHGRLGVPRERA